MTLKPDALLTLAPATVTNVPDGFDALILADLARAARGSRHDAPGVVHVARDGARLAALERALAFMAPDVELLVFPAWDCQPYDRVSPNAAVVAQRTTTLARLARTRGGDAPRLVLTTVNAALQRIATPESVARQSFSAAPGNMVDLKALAEWLEINGFLRSSTVRDYGEYAIRGGIVDLFPAGHAEPIRLDFFGDTLESIRPFDPETQRSTGQLRALDLVPMSEVQLTSDTIRRFRQSYAATFGAPGRDDQLYAAISEGRRYAGLEHWSPLFHDGMATLFDHLADARFVLDPLAEDAAGERLALIADYYDARVTQAKQDKGGGSYKPLKPDALYLAPAEWRARLDETAPLKLTPFSLPEGQGGRVFDAGARAGRSFAAERADENANVFDAVAAHIRELKEDGKRVVVAAWSEGARDRLGTVLGDHGLKATRNVASWRDAMALPKDAVALGVLGLEQGFETDEVVVVAEQDILGDRLVRAKTKRRRPQDYLTEAAGLAAGDLVVHVDHGIGRFVGLKTIEAAGAPHDCVELHYANNDKLFLPVENIELLTRYGSEETEAVLDRLGGAGWQSRKARLKNRIREMAGELIKIAAARMTKEAPRAVPPEGLYDEFCARFPYDETEDQQAAIDAVLDDLAAGRPMDRLICGDVGFGKTEVALRAAFVVAMSGRQVAVIVPTTLLARQHFKTFAERFRGLPLKVRQASRFVSQKDMTETKKGLASGDVDIVVGTHALLGKGIGFRDLGLVIVDEEQHFGVGHKEKMKTLRAEVHVLTLSATPIPRTLQLALTGVRELSMIATPPVDRLTVRSFVAPFDPLIVREALLRERYRGGQSFFVCPHIEDLAAARTFLESQVPEVKFVVANGQMAAGDLEQAMTDFYEGRYDVLLSTAIVESGLDIPNANTLVVYRADMFGLAALYQLRGRVGRAKTRAYALFTVPANKAPTVNAERRLKVLQSLEGLGAGFQLASHDLDIRGAGNLLGEEQSGHIREVGYELYQQMLEDAVESLKEGGAEVVADQWSPQITLGAPVMIPEEFVGDLAIRLSLYRRLAEIDTDEGLDSFAAELVDRFGPLPSEVKQLLEIAAIKALCRRANVEKIDAGPKGVVLAFRENSFANPDGLVRHIAIEEGPNAKVRPDMKIVFKREWPTVEKRLKGAAKLLRDLVKIAEAGKKAA
ncbi:transcription-repair coupling factor (superfamily II helicase) [Methylopila capsulata]|uniref:Transcription-repair-coupling factor n=1 Tax=Methylopila capsulata TaxID=61654 RepID=A0A9W6ISD5_9HYPH|nr:transcription-repair coupling factor [Methylopila capsulata]MBM7850358.1 transcription-repair coupling factor (superfamily II helicase) [Methylopila capsulata]GLK55651.1 transcription-repair-coupling factor [Methylopila capsulata]